jgi:hypothetical protein
LLLLPPSHDIAKNLLKFQNLSLQKRTRYRYCTPFVRHCSAIFICAFEWYLSYCALSQIYLIFMERRAYIGSLTLQVL